MKGGEAEGRADVRCSYNLFKCLELSIIYKTYITIPSWRREWESLCQFLVLFLSCVLKSPAFKWAIPKRVGSTNYCKCMITCTITCIVSVFFLYFTLVLWSYCQELRQNENLPTTEVRLISMSRSTSKTSSRLGPAGKAQKTIVKKPSDYRVI